MKSVIRRPLIISFLLSSVFLGQNVLALNSFEDIQSNKPSLLVSQYDEDLKRLNDLGEGQGSLELAVDIVKKYAGFDEVALDSKWSSSKNSQQELLVRFIAKNLKSILPAIRDGSYLMANCQILRASGDDRFRFKPVNYRNKYVLRIDVSQFSGMLHETKNLGFIDNPLPGLGGEKQIKFDEITNILTLGGKDRNLPSERSIKSWISAFINYGEYCYRVNYDVTE